MAKLTALLAAAAVVAAAPGSAGAATPDYDGDGATGTADCRPLNPAVHPGAPDLPDLGFLDSNCDGIDGNKAEAVFVSVSGDDAGLGIDSNPYRTIGKGIAEAAAADPVKDVYVTGGNFTQSLQAADGVGVYGGYAPGTWTRSVEQVTTVTGAPQALLADGDQGVVLQMLTLQGGAGSPGSPSSYGLRAIAGSTVLLDGVTATGGQAATGAAGADAATPTQAAAGQPGFAAICGGLPASGGLGGVGSLGRTGGTGGAGGLSLASLPTLGLPGGGNSSMVPGAAGQQGIAGGLGAHAPLLQPVTAAWDPNTGSTGGVGTAGAAGNGGTGGAGDTQSWVFGQITAGGGGGGGGGGAGAGGPGGVGGRSGGGSFGAFLHNSNVVALDSTLTGGRGGNGGNGGLGGAGGAGGAGGLGGTGATCSNGFATAMGRVGQTGGAGGRGGPGGAGGAGTGGPSVGVYRSGPTSAFTATNAEMVAGAPGSGGTQPGGTAAASGAAQGLLMPAGTPTTSGDFDDDGTLDSVDGCVAVPGTVSGCPADTVKPVLLVGGSAKQRMLTTKKVAFTVTSGEACTGSAKATLGSRTLGSLSARAVPAETRKSYSIGLDARDLSAIRTALSRSGADVVKVVVTCIDAALNAGTATKKITIIR